MSASRIDGRFRVQDHPERGRAASLGAADGLSLAAAPAFAIMALLAAAHGAGPVDVLCSAAHGASLLGGMVPMYVLMSAVHLAPWVRLIARRRRSPRTRLGGVESP